PQAILNDRGQCALPGLVAAARGRCVAAHFGTYDYTAGCNITAAHQHMLHPACDFARDMMQVALAGTSIWLDRRLSAEEKSSPQGEARVWMVHSGGFYAVGKVGSQQVVPGRLRWFRWEAALTWLSGMVLLVLVYYHGGALIDTHIADIGLGTGAAIGLGVLILA
ncbi:urate hydroxylase PuuD, partial [Acidobacteriia bacterium AH_259_A11_L15]|nr:urate hydroxylase PuuD [Acidobacteriia bacterium AH_259_A11_L15]